MSAEQVAAFTLGLLPQDYVDVDWCRLLRVLPTLGRGFAGIVQGEAIEEAYPDLLGDITLGELPIPAYTPVPSPPTRRYGTSSRIGLNSSAPERIRIFRWHAQCTWR
jgi:hypothetical protein